MGQHRGRRSFALWYISPPANTSLRPQLHNEDIFKWDIALIVLNKDSAYYGGYFKARMTFPQNYPYSPPGTFDVCYHSDLLSLVARLADMLFSSHLPVTPLDRDFAY